MSTFPEPSKGLFSSRGLKRFHITLQDKFLSLARVHKFCLLKLKNIFCFICWSNTRAFAVIGWRWSEVDREEFDRCGLFGWKILIWTGPAGTSSTSMTYKMKKNYFQKVCISKSHLYKHFNDLKNLSCF